MLMFNKNDTSMNMIWLVLNVMKAYAFVFNTHE